MIVFDLRCGRDHVFEAWFGSSAGYESQRAAGQIACPICDDRSITKAVMAPNIGAKGNQVAPALPRAQPAVPDRPGVPDGAAFQQALAAVAEVQARMLKDSRWVGSAFATEARAMHAGDVPTAPIHGRATSEEARALLDDGVAVAPLLVPVVPPEERN